MTTSMARQLSIPGLTRRDARQWLWLITVALAMVFMALLGGEHIYRHFAEPGFDLCRIKQGWSCQDALQHPWSTVALLPVPFWALAAYALILRLGPNSWGHRPARLLAVSLTSFFLLASGLFLFFMARDLPTLCLLCLGAHACHLTLALLLVAGLGPTLPARAAQSVPSASGSILAPLLILVVGYALTTLGNQYEGKRALVRHLTQDGLLPAVLLGEIDRYAPEKAFQLIAGKKDAANQLTVVGSLACKHCRSVLRAVPGLPDKIKQEVAIYFVPYPLAGACNQQFKEKGPRAPEQCLLAERTFMAQEMGVFWDWFQEADRAPGRSLRHLRAQAGDKKEWDPNFTYQIEAVQDLAITALPLLLWNGQKLPGMVNALPLEDLLSYLLGQQTKTPKPSPDDACGVC